LAGRVRDAAHRVGRVVAELALVGGQAHETAAGGPWLVAALALGLYRNARRVGGAGVAVRFTVAAAHRIVVTVAGVRLRLALAGRVRLAAHRVARVATELALPAHHPLLAATRLRGRRAAPTVGRRGAGRGRRQGRVV